MGLAPDWTEVLEHTSRLSRDARESDRRTVSRLKQWLNYAHKRKAVNWFDAVKHAQSSRDLLVLARLKASAERMACDQAA